VSAANPRQRRRFPLPRRTVRFRVGAVVLLALLAGWQYVSRGPGEPRPHEPGTTVLVLRAVDGDTLLLADHTRIRLLGVDTPETKRPDTPVEPFGPEASEFTRSHVEGRSVRLEFDKERYDKYGRVLAYVYRDDWFLNEALLRAGLGRAITNHPYSESMKRRFRAAESEARRARRGIWSLENGGHPHNHEGRHGREGPGTGYRVLRIPMRREARHSSFRQPEFGADRGPGLDVVQKVQPVDCRFAAASRSVHRRSGGDHFFQ
jgi:micrococcal nuclease